MPGMLDLEDVFQLVDNGLTDSPLAQQDGIGHRGYELGFHVFSELCNQMNSLEKQLLKQGLRQIPFITEELAKQLPGESLHLQRGAIIGVSRSEHKIHHVTGVTGN